VIICAAGEPAVSLLVFRAALCAGLAINRLAESGGEDQCATGKGAGCHAVCARAGLELVLPLARLECVLDGDHFPPSSTGQFSAGVRLADGQPMGPCRA